MTHPTPTCIIPQRVISARRLSPREIERLQQLCATSCAADGLAIPLASELKALGRSEKALANIEGVERLYSQSMVQMLEGITPQTVSDYKTFFTELKAFEQALPTTLAKQHPELTINQAQALADVCESHRLNWVQKHFKTGIDIRTHKGKGR